LFFHTGDVEPLTKEDIVGRARASLTDMENGPLAGSVPYTPLTDGIMNGLATLKPHTLATMHGSSFTGDGERAFRDMAVVLRELFSVEARAETAR
jgi:hypothetical protein